MSSELAINSLPEKKMYITIDLEKFPGLMTEVDESIRFEGSGRVCEVRHNDYCHEMQVEVTKISIPSHTQDTIGPVNEADIAMGKLKTGRKY